MDKNKLNFAELILQIVSTIILFVPGFYTMQIWSESGYGEMTLSYERYTSFSQVSIDTSIMVFVAILLVMLVNTAFELLCILGKRVANKFVSCITALIPIVVISVFSFTVSGGMEKYQYPVSWLFYVELCIQIIIFALVIIKNFGKLQENTPDIHSN